MIVLMYKNLFFKTNQQQLWAVATTTCQAEAPQAILMYANSEEARLLLAKKC